MINSKQFRIDWMISIEFMKTLFENVSPISGRIINMQCLYKRKSWDFTSIRWITMRQRRKTKKNIDYLRPHEFLLNFSKNSFSSIVIWIWGVQSRLSVCECLKWFRRKLVRQILSLSYDRKWFEIVRSHVKSQEPKCWRLLKVGLFRCLSKSIIFLFCVLCYFKMIQNDGYWKIGRWSIKLIIHSQ